MQQIATLFGDIKPKFNNYHEFQIIGKEMTDYFGKSCYWLFTKYNHSAIKDAFKRAQEKGIKDLPYFVGMVKRWK